MSSQPHFALKQIPHLKEILPAYPGLKALFFDMDGTLFNTEKYHTQAMLAIGDEFKIRPPYSPDAVHQLMMGKADHLVFDLIKDWEGFPKHWVVRDFVEAKNAHLLRLLSNEKNKEYFPMEMKSLLDEAKESKLYLALVTSSEKIITMELLKLVGLNGFFKLIITRDDCPTHKPDPYPYLKALKIAGVSAHEALIFEDSNVGLLAADGSGCHVIKAEWYL